MTSDYLTFIPTLCVYVIIYFMVCIFCKILACVCVLFITNQILRWTLFRSFVFDFWRCKQQKEPKIQRNLNYDASKTYFLVRFSFFGYKLHERQIYSILSFSCFDEFNALFLRAQVLCSRLFYLPLLSAFFGGRLKSSYVEVRTTPSRFRTVLYMNYVHAFYSYKIIYSFDSGETALRFVLN